MQMLNANNYLPNKIIKLTFYTFQPLQVAMNLNLLMHIKSSQTSIFKGRKMTDINFMKMRDFHHIGHH